MGSERRARSKRDNRNHRRRRLKWRLAIVAAAALCLVVALLASVPVRFEAVPQGLQRLVNDHLGMELKLDGAELWVLPPRIVLEHPCLAAAAAGPGDEGLKADRLEVSLNPFWWGFGIGKPLRSVHLVRPEPLLLRAESGSLLWPAVVQAVLERMSQKGAKDRTAEIPLSFLEIRDAALTVVQGFDRATALPVRAKSQTYETTIAAVLVSAFQIRELTGQRYAVRCSGEITVRDAPSPFMIRGTFLGNSEFAGELESPAFRAYWPMGFRGSVATEARETRMDLRVLRRDTETEFVADASVGALALSMPTHSIAYQDENVHVALRGSIEWGTRQVVLTKASIESPQIQVEAAGRGQWDARLSYEANLLASRIGAPYIELLNAPLPRGFELSAGDGLVQANLHITGIGPQVRSTVGKLTFSSVTLQTPHLRRVLRELRGELDFEPQRLVFHELAGKLGQATLTVGGELVGDYVTSRTGTLRLRWQSHADARELAELLQSAAPQVGQAAEAVAPLGGTIVSEGELEQTVVGEPSYWPAPVVRGKLRVQNLAFRHKALPTAVSDMNGDLEIENARIRTESLRAKLGDSQLVASGELAGDRYFWRDPVLSATLAVAANVSSWVQSLEPNLRNQISAYRPSGQVAATVQCHVPLSAWQRAEIKGSATLTQAGFELATEYVRAKVANLDAEAAWDGKRLALKSFRGEVSGIRASGSGTVDESKIALQLNASGNLEQVQGMFPRMEPFAEIHGPALCETSIEIGEAHATADSAAQNQLFKLIAGLGPRVLRGYQNGRILINGQVVAGNSHQGASFRHHSMPPARTLPYGLSVPRGEIADIHGVLELKGTTIEVPENAPVRCTMADTPNCRLSGTITFVPNHYPSIKFRIETTDEARLDTWITGWGADFHPPVRRGLSQKGKRFELTGTIVAPRATYKGEHVGQCSGEIAYIYISGEPPRRTEFRNVAIEGFGGTMRGNGLIESWREKPDEYPRWQADVQLNHVRIPPLSRWVFRDPKLVEGSLTGHIELKGVKTDVQRLNGKGRVNLLEVEVGRLPFILKLFQIVNLTQTRGLFEKAAYNSKHEAHFQISDGMVTWDKVDLETEGLLLELRGRYFLEDHRIDAQVRLNLFESSLLGAIPLVGDLARMADRTLGKVIVAFRVSGLAAQPSITPIPLPLFQYPTP